MRNAIALLVSDLHLCSKQPSFRKDENWMVTQAEYLDQIVWKANLLGVTVICAGDIFDRWNAAPEVINLALSHLPEKMICVPGQHDLPNHSYELMSRSAYWTLVEAGKIIDLSQSRKPGEELLDPKRKFLAYGFGWGRDVCEPEEVSPATAMDWLPKIAVIHRYCYLDKSTAYPGAPKEAHLASISKPLRKYNFAVIGDNHKDFVAKAGKCQIINCGGFIRRKSDEVDRVPKMTVAYDDGTYEQINYNTEIDKFGEREEAREGATIDIKEFLDGLEDLGGGGLDFEEAVRNHLKFAEELHPTTKELVLQHLTANQ